MVDGGICASTGVFLVIISLFGAARGEGFSLNWQILEQLGVANCWQKNSYCVTKGADSRADVDDYSGSEENLLIIWGKQ